MSARLECTRTGSGAPHLPRTARGAASVGLPMVAVGTGRRVVVTGTTVTVTVGSQPSGGAGYTARLVGTWDSGYTPTEADATMLEVLADHAGAVVHRERTIRGLTDQATVRHAGSALGEAQRIAASAGVLMALHYLSPAQARHLLTRAGDRTDQSLLHTADTVLHTGALPGSWLAPVDTEKQPEPS